jgi:hypothetical protein
MAHKKQSIGQSLACQAVLCLFDIAIFTSGLLPEDKKEAVYQETAMRMLSTMSFAPDPHS